MRPRVNHLREPARGRDVSCLDTGRTGCAGVPRSHTFDREELCWATPALAAQHQALQCATCSPITTCPERYGKPFQATIVPTSRSSRDNDVSPIIAVVQCGRGCTILDRGGFESRRGHPDDRRVRRFHAAYNQ